MSWSKGSDVQRELARKHARQLMTAFDEVMKRENSGACCGRGGGGGPAERLPGRLGRS